MIKKLLQLTYWMILLVGIILSQTGVARNDKVTFLNEVTINKNDLYLSDIIYPKSFQEIDVEFQVLLREIRIGDAPKAGETLRFTNYAISEIIRHQLKNKNQSISGKYSFEIPNEIQVVRKSKLDIQEMEKNLREWVQRSCEDCEVQISNLRIQGIAAKEMNHEMADLEWKLNTSENIPRGTFTLPIELSKNNKVEKRMWLQGQVKLFKQVPVARRDLGFGVKLQMDDVEFQKRDVTFERNSVPHVNELYGSEIAQFVSSSQILWKKNLKRKLALTRGALVSVLLQNNGWKIVAKSVAQENGYIGDYVKVQNPESKKILTGLITSDGTVEVK